MSEAREPWEWGMPTVQRLVRRVRAGRRLVPEAWPGDARVAVALSFDTDHETIYLRDAQVSPGVLSRGEYGSRVGVSRVLQLLEQYGIPASFFVPAVCSLLYPAEVKGYVERGHEVGIHGWIHERNMLLDHDTERDLQLRSADQLERATGKRPVGIRTPSWDFSDHTLDISREMGLLYDSSLMADDDPYEIVADGTPTGMVEIPVEWIRDDAVYFPMERYSSLRPLASPQAVLDLWKDEFDAAYAEHGLFQLTMHPHIIGHRSRITLLNELLRHILGYPHVWFGTHADVARAALSSSKRG